MAVRRNLLIVVAQGLRSDALGDSGAWPLATPSIDKLCRRGRRLVARSASPGDEGGMISLLTALHARQHGNIETCRHISCTGWIQMLAAQGYHVVGVGCVANIASCLHDVTLVENVDLVEAPKCAYMKSITQRGVRDAVIEQRRQRLRYGPFAPDRLALEADDDIDSFISSKAQAKLQQLDPHRPWALLVIFSGPGNDLPPPAAYADSAQPSQLEAGFVPADLTQVNVLAELDYPRVMLQRLSAAGIGRIRSDYLGRLALIDHAIGQILASLESRVDQPQTWVVLTSNRGHLLGEHGLVGHRSFLSAAIEVPLLLVPPTPVRPGTADTTGISTVDAAATIASLGNCDLPSAVAGRSLLSLVADADSDDWRLNSTDTCLSEYGRRLMLETPRHKVIFDTVHKKAIGLYDLVKDSDEKQNLIGTPTALDVLSSLRSHLGDALLPLRAMG